ncbi:MAG: zinc ribbon domain-containing protein [Candidatus Aminicenantes bacterium]|nr:zinc ribbon domain-containing protein [Candidatus Aminicenantes bacterium]
MTDAIDMATILKYVRYVSFAISIILILRMLRQYRKIRSLSLKSCLVAIVFPVAALLVYSIIIGSSLPSIALTALFAFGLALGLWQGRKTKVWIESGRPRAQNTVWFLIVWALSYALMQGLLQLGNRLSLKVGIGSMMASTAIAVGSQGLLLIRLSRTGELPMRRPAAVPSSAEAHGFRASGSSAPAAPHERRYCSSCGARLVPGDRFCRACRAVVR